MAVAGAWPAHQPHITRARTELCRRQTAGIPGRGTAMMCRRLSMLSVRVRMHGARAAAPRAPARATPRPQRPWRVCGRATPEFGHTGEWCGNQSFNSVSHVRPTRCARCVAAQQTWPTQQLIVGHFEEASARARANPIGSSTDSQATIRSGSATSTRSALLARVAMPARGLDAMRTMRIRDATH